MTNLIGNYSLETDTSGWANVGGAGDIISRENTPYTAVDGTWYGTKEVTGAGSRNLDYGSIPVTPGSFYSFGFYGRWKTGATPKNLRLDVRWFDSTGTAINTDTGTSTAVTTGAWTQLTRLNMQAPKITNGQTADAVTAALRIVVLSAAVGDIFAWDAAQCNAGATLESLTPQITWTISKYVKFG